MLQKLQETNIIFLDMDSVNTAGDKFDQLRNELSNIQRCIVLDQLDSNAIRDAGVIVILQSPYVQPQNDWSQVMKIVERYEPFPQIILIVNGEDQGNKTQVTSEIAAYFFDIVKVESIIHTIYARFEQYQYELLLEILRIELNKAAETSDIKKVAQVLFHFLDRAIGFDECTISLLSEKQTLQTKDEPPHEYNFRSLFAYCRRQEGLIGPPVYGSGSESDLLIQRGYLKPIQEDETMKAVLVDQHPRVYFDLNKKPFTKWDDSRIKSWIVIPLILSTRQNGLMGVITLDKYQARQSYVLHGITITEVDLEMLAEDLGQIIADVIHAFLLKRNQRLLQAIIRSVTTEYNIQTLLRKILKQLHEGLDSDRTAYFRRQEAGGPLPDTYLEKWQFYPEQENVTSITRYPPTLGAERRGIGGRILRDGKSLLIHNTKHSEFGADFIDEKDNPKWSDNKPRSMLAVPVIVQSQSQDNQIINRLIGAFFLDKHQLAHFSQYDLDLVTQVAEFTTVLIERTWTLQLIQATSIAVNGASDDVDGLLRKIISNAMVLTNATSGVIDLIEKTDSNKFRRIQSVAEPQDEGYPNEAWNPEPRFEDAQSTSYQLLHASVETKGEPRDFSKEYLNSKLRERGIVTVLGTLLLSDTEDPIGLLYLHSKSKAQFNDIEKQSLRLFATHAAIAVQKRRNVENLERQQKVREKVREAMLKLGQQAAKREIMDTLIDIPKIVADLVGTSQQSPKSGQTHLVHILLVDKPGILRFKAVYPDQSNQLIGLETKYKNGFSYGNTPFGVIGNAAFKKQIERIGDVANCRYYEAYHRDTRSELAVPILDQNDEVLGVINVEHNSLNGFDTIDEDAVRLFASYVAIYLQTTELLQTYKNLNAAFRENLDRLINVTVSIKTIRKLPDTRRVLERMIDLVQESVKHSIVLMLIPEIKTKENTDRQFRVITYRGRGYRSVEQGEFGNVTNSKAIEVLEHFSGDPSFFQGAQNEALQEFQKMCNKCFGRDVGTIKSGIYLPVMGRDYPSGVLCIGFLDERDDHYFERDEIQLYEFYASQISAVYDIVSREFGDERESITQNMQRDYDDTRSDANHYYRLSYFVSLGAAVFIAVGLVLMIFGVVAALIQFSPWEFMAILVGLLTDITSTFIFTRSDAYRKRLDSYHTERLGSKQLEDLLTAANQISDIATRDKVKMDIIQHASGGWLNKSTSADLKISNPNSTMPTH